MVFLLLFTHYADFLNTNLRSKNVSIKTNINASKMEFDRDGTM